MKSAVTFISSRPQARAQGWLLNHRLGCILFLVLLLSMINGMMPQAEMAFFSGHVLIPTVALKWLMIVIAAFGVLKKKKQTQKTKKVKKETRKNTKKEKKKKRR
jgi:uncharacterized membrane protein